MKSFTKIEYLSDEVLCNNNVDWFDVQMDDVIVDEMPKTMYDVD